EGDGAPARAYVDAAWILGIGHAHNSYLDLLANLGLVGFCLVVLGLVIAPLRNLLTFRTYDQAGGVAFAWILFGILGNLTKSQFLDRDRPEWVIFVLAVSIIHQS